MTFRKFKNFSEQQNPEQSENLKMCANSNQNDYPLVVYVVGGLVLSFFLWIFAACLHEAYLGFKAQ